MITTIMYIGAVVIEILSFIVLGLVIALIIKGLRKK